MWRHVWWLLSTQCCSLSPMRHVPSDPVSTATADHRCFASNAPPTWSPSDSGRVGVGRRRGNFYYLCVGGGTPSLCDKLKLQSIVGIKIQLNSSWTVLLSLGVFYSPSIQLRRLVAFQNSSAPIRTNLFQAIVTAKCVKFRPLVTDK